MSLALTGTVLTRNWPRATVLKVKLFPDSIVTCDILLTVTVTAMFAHIRLEGPINVNSRCCWTPHSLELVTHLSREIWTRFQLALRIHSLSNLHKYIRVRLAQSVEVGSGNAGVACHKVRRWWIESWHYLLIVAMCSRPGHDKNLLSRGYDIGYVLALNERYKINMKSIFNIMPCVNYTKTLFKKKGIYVDHEHRVYLLVLF